MYPSPRIGMAMFANDGDPDYLLAMVRAYNDWISEYCAASSGRLLGLALAPSGGGIESCVKEVERALKLPAIKGVLLHKYPTAGLRLKPEDDPLFKLCAEAGVPLHIHVGLAGSESATPKQGHEFTGAFTGCYRFYDSPIRMSEMIYTGLLDRVPDIKMVWAEVDVGWVGYVMEQLDDRIARQNPANRIKLKGKPSDYFKRNFFYTVVKDAYGIRNRHDVGVSQILWSSDFPHATCDYPDYAAAIKHDFKGVPDNELQMMLTGNAAKLYGLKDLM
jgi:predicted TIM-barrel fold metal-dependent hydrolase